MPVEIPTHLTPELVPLSWLLGTWSGEGRLGAGNEGDERIRQQVTFSQDGLPFLRYEARSWLVDGEGRQIRPLTSEAGFWALDRPMTDADVGPGMRPAEIVPALKSAEEVEELRNEAGGFDITATIVHPGGIAELYYGSIKGAVVELGTDLVMRGRSSKEYAAATRLYGLVNGSLFFRWDVQEDGEMKPHASVAMAKIAEPPAPEPREEAGDGKPSEGADGTGVNPAEGE
ncbi:FABP family protein [Falsarthrobacter nasiphocae]|uniref:Peroxynitrite isomerase n=1 Tax=Falsarthrobacter nasiphocae TaxID=189863 RepID=A0AAE4C8K0_9MICC|nr:FABP family protein [Falsarthrobacter nasiphocae]MDR6892495.1 hypothetical protein [Falsarthrobacter nasiphocae]